jgi:hypothetical protein
MSLSDPRRRQLEACLQDIQSHRPIDNAQIERALVALIEVLLEDNSASGSGRATRTS